MSNQRTETFRGLIVGDPHIAVRPPGWRTPETWDKEFESLMGQVYDLAVQFSVDFVACTGDWFHSKAASSHADVLRGIRGTSRIVEHFGPILSGLGNHDMVGHSISDADRRQPIAVLEAAGTIRRIDREAVFIEKGKEKILVAAAPYCPGPPRFKLTTRVDKDIINSLAGMVLLLHHDLYLQQEPKASRVLLAPKDFIGAYYRPGIPVVWGNGHIHDDQGVIDSGRDAFANIGALARIATSESSLVPQSLLVSISPKKTVAKMLSLEVASPEASYAAEARTVGDDAEPDENLARFLSYLAEEDRSTGRESAETLLRSFAAARGDPDGAVEAAVEVLSSVAQR